MEKLNIMVVALALTLTGCTASWVRYDARSMPANCPPVVSVTSLGGNITINDTTQCRTEK
ncbi:hypothetical protein CWR41_22515 [Cedecea lapagei]|nr:hypothetical protein CWR41_22515 [Cedecea lapagei]